MFKSTDQIKEKKDKLEAKQAGILKKPKKNRQANRASATMSERIYLDYNATTGAPPEVFDQRFPIMKSICPSVLPERQANLRNKELQARDWHEYYCKRPTKSQ